MTGKEDREGPWKIAVCGSRRGGENPVRFDRSEPTLRVLLGEPSDQKHRPQVHASREAHQPVRG